MERGIPVKIRYLLTAGLALVWVAALVIPFATGFWTDTAGSAGSSVDTTVVQTENTAYDGHVDKQKSEDLNEAIRSGEHPMVGGINGPEESLPGTGW
jgi:hypothetical protein